MKYYFLLFLYSINTCLAAEGINFNVHVDGLGGSGEGLIVGLARGNDIAIVTANHIIRPKGITGKPYATIRFDSMPGFKEQAKILDLHSELNDVAILIVRGLKYPETTVSCLTELDRNPNVKFIQRNAFNAITYQSGTYRGLDSNGDLLFKSNGVEPGTSGSAVLDSNNAVVGIVRGGGSIGDSEWDVKVVSIKRIKELFWGERNTFEFEHKTNKVMTKEDKEAQKLEDYCWAYESACILGPNEHEKDCEIKNSELCQKILSKTNKIRDKYYTSVEWIAKTSCDCRWDENLNLPDNLQYRPEVRKYFSCSSTRLLSDFKNKLANMTINNYDYKGVLQSYLPSESNLDTLVQAEDRDKLMRIQSLRNDNIYEYTERKIHLIKFEMIKEKIEQDQLLAPECFIITDSEREKKYNLYSVKEIFDTEIAAIVSPITICDIYYLRTNIYRNETITRKDRLSSFIGFGEEWFFIHTVPPFVYDLSR